MSIITAIFEAKTHEEFGEVGLAMVGRSWADPYSGMAVAHDILEHGIDDTGTQEEELMALGASFYVRDMGNYFQRKGQRDCSPAANIAADMPEQVHIMNNASKQYWKDPGRVRLCESHIERELIEIVIETKRYISGLRQAEVPPAFKQATEFTKMKRWLRKGYHRAVKQYADLRPHQVCDLFEQIEEKADRFLKHAEPYGDQCEITVDFAKRSVVLREIYPYNDKEDNEELEDE